MSATVFQQEMMMPTNEEIEKEIQSKGLTAPPSNHERND